MSVHPVADLFPLMTDAEIADLAADIAQHGQREPIWLHRDGRIIDGRNRWRACMLANSGVMTRTYDGPDEGLVAFVVSLNLKRRHLSESQRAMVAARVANLPHGANQWTRQLAGPTQTDAADLLNVSERSVQRAAVVRDEGTPELAAAVDRGDIAVSAAAEIARQPVERQKEALAQVDPRVIAAVAREFKERRREEARAERDRRDADLASRSVQVPLDIDVRVADCLDLISSLDNGSVDLLLTDPPYAVTENDWDVWESPETYWKFMREWLDAMRPKMAERSHAFIFCDADASPQLWQALTDLDWPVLRQAIWHRPNLAKKRAGSLTFLSAYEPFWHCGTHGLHLPDEWGDERFDVQRFAVPQSTHAVDTAHHPTQKPLDLFRRLVRVGARAGQLVVDPFCGAGTTALACKHEARACITGDTNEHYVAIARGRLA